MENGSIHGEEDEEYKTFLALHSPALKAAGIPPLYWKTLHYKLSNEVHTGGTAAAVSGHHFRLTDSTAPLQGDSSVNKPSSVRRELTENSLVKTAPLSPRLELPAGFLLLPVRLI